MKKLSLLVGTLGGAMAGYLFSNKTLREELMRAKDPEAAAKALGRHLQKDGKKVAMHVQDFVASEEVQTNIKKAKTYAKTKVDHAKTELKEFVGKEKKQMKKKAKGAKKKAKRTVKRAKAKVKKTAKKTAKRVRTKIKSVS